jgi:hypothetical protein
MPDGTRAKGKLVKVKSEFEAMLCETFIETNEGQAKKGFDDVCALPWRARLYSLPIRVRRKGKGVEDLDEERQHVRMEVNCSKHENLRVRQWHVQSFGTQTRVLVGHRQFELGV